MHLIKELYKKNVILLLLMQNCIFKNSDIFNFLSISYYRNILFYNDLWIEEFRGKGGMT